MNKLIILRGYPGAGKTTIGKALASNSVGIFVDHNAILTFIANITGDDEGIYEDIANLELAIARKLLQEEKTVIVARGFSKESSITPYINLAKSLNISIYIIRLEVNERLLAERVQSVERNNDFNPTTTPEALQSWVDENPIEDIINELRVDNSKPVVEVVDIIKNGVKEND